MSLLRIENLVVRFGAATVVNDVSFSIARDISANNQTLWEHTCGSIARDEENLFVQ